MLVHSQIPAEPATVRERKPRRLLRTKPGLGIGCAKKIMIRWQTEETLKRNTLTLLVALAAQENKETATKTPAKSEILHPEMTVETGSYDKPAHVIGTKPSEPWTSTTVAAGVDKKPEPGRPVTVVGEVVCCATVAASLSDCANTAVRRRTTATDWYPPVGFPARYASKLLIPAGPRNPVGLAWISLSLPGYGMHGTPHPEQIGKTGSHGCFRLANWDAQRLAKMVRPGVGITFVGDSTGAFASVN